MERIYLLKNSFNSEVIEKLCIKTKEVNDFIDYLLDNGYMTDDVYLEEIGEDIKTKTF